MKQLISFLLLATALSFSALGTERPTSDNPFKNYSNDIILKWNTIVLETMSTPAYDPMVGSRIFTMVHLAMHDALNNIEPVFETYLAHQQERKADPIAAIENADSRVFAGLHFRFSCDRGLEMGNQIGSYIEKTQLRPKSGI